MRILNVHTGLEWTMCVAYFRNVSSVIYELWCWFENGVWRIFWERFFYHNSYTPFCNEIWTKYQVNLTVAICVQHCGKYLANGQLFSTFNWIDSTKCQNISPPYIIHVIFRQLAKQLDNLPLHNFAIAFEQSIK